MDPFDLATLILRIALGGVLVAHGVKHLRGRVKTTYWFDSIGFRAPGFQWFASTSTEIGAGVLLISGFLTTAAAAGVIGVMAVAFVSVHRSAGFWVTARPEEGWEYIMVLSVSAAALAIMGPGAVSLDAVSGLDVLLDGWIGAGAVAVGTLAAGAQLAVFHRP